MSTAVAENTGLIKVEEITGVMTSAGEVLVKNQSLVEKCVAKGESFLDTCEAGMNDELDKELNDWQVKAKQAMQIMNDRRAPVTQIMDRLKKVFTEMEGRIDPKKPESIYSKVQAYRNKWATQKAEEQRRKEQEILRKQNVDRERIELKARIEQQVREYYQNSLFSRKKHYSDLFNTMFLDNVVDIGNKINDMPLTWPRDKWETIEVRVSAVYLDKTELASLVFDTKMSLYDELNANFRENMEDHQQNLLAQIPARKKELEEIKKADKTKREQLEAEAKKRQEEEAERLKKEQEESLRKQQEELEMKKNIEHAGTLFDTQMELSAVQSDAASTRSGYVINVLNPAGWGAIFMFWFEKEGKNLSNEQIGKKSMDQMKSFCEKYAHKNNDKISSPHLEYREEIKAVAKKGA